jgi:hypothetical protein
MKSIWLREEIPIADELAALIPKLTEDFLNYHSDFFDDYTKGKRFYDPVYGNESATYSGWTTEHFKYICPPVENLNYLKPEIKKRFPTAVELTEKWGDDCITSGYTILDSGATIKRHCDQENKSNKFLRIHIPLIVPKGDVFFEVDGYEIDWQDIFGFNNQLFHSAYNLSDQRRLLYVVDIKREVLGIPDGVPYDSEYEKNAAPFIRGRLPKVYHTKQLTQ